VILAGALVTVLVTIWLPGKFDPIMLYLLALALYHGINWLVWGYP
jgi:hypothetical protein